MMKKVLMFRGGWEGHEPVQTSDLVAETLRRHKVAVDCFNDQSCLLDPELKQKYQLIVPVWTMGTLGDAESKALLDAVKNGVAVGGWHGGMGDAFRSNTEYQFMCGGQWVAHPGNIIDYTVKITDKTHPITAGIKDFAMHSEQYYMHVDPSNEVLAETEIVHEHTPWIKKCVMPVVWTRRYGKGKVFYSSLGHNLADFKNVPEVLEITVRGLLWALAD